MRGSEDMDTHELAKVARDDFLGAWDDMQMRGVYDYSENKWNHHGDDLAHINHVAEDDERGQELKENLIRNLRDRAAEMNMRVSEKIAPLEELEILLERCEEQTAEEQAQDDPTDGKEYEKPPEATRGDTPSDVYDTVYRVEKGDKIAVTVDAEAKGEWDYIECDDREEVWVGTVSSVGYDRRKNLHGVKGHFELKSPGGGDSGHARVSHHPKFSPKKGLAFGENAGGSRAEFHAPVSPFEDDRDRTVIDVEIL